MSGRILRRADLAKLREAEATLADARALRDQAMRDADALRERTLREALEEGRERGAREAAALLAQGERQAAERMRALEPALAGLVAETVARVIGEMDRREAVGLATRRALERLRDHRRARISAAPDVVEAVREAVAAASATSSGAEVLEVVADERLEPGRTLLSSDRGHVEIGLPAQLAEATRSWRADAA